MINDYDVYVFWSVYCLYHRHLLDVVLLRIFASEDATVPCAIANVTSDMELELVLLTPGNVLVELEFYCLTVQCHFFQTALDVFIFLGQSEIGKL